MQSNIVLKDVIQMLLCREADAMLAPVITSDAHPVEKGDLTAARPEALLMSVEETLRLPMQLRLGAANDQHNRRQYSAADTMMRLNESLASVQRGKAYRPCSRVLLKERR
jgi:hypothetical protein